MNDVSRLNYFNLVSKICQRHFETRAANTWELTQRNHN